MTSPTSPQTSQSSAGSSLESSSTTFSDETKNDISKVVWSTWWELPPSLDESELDQPGYFPSSTTHGAVRLLRRCQAEYGWDFGSAKRILMAYKDFLYAVSFLPSDHWLIPCPLVRDIWQLHICDTQRYATDCQLLLGRIVHYNNYLHDDGDVAKDDDNEKEDSVQDKQRQQRKHKWRMIQKTIKFICEKTNQEELDPDVWQYMEGKSGVLERLMSQSVTSQPIQETKPLLSLKRNGCSASNDNGDGDESDQCGATSKNRKKMRLNRHDARSRDHPWYISSNTSQAKPSKVSLQIEFSSTTKQYHLAWLAKNSLDVAQNQELDRQSLQFTYRGQVLEGTETPHALSKYYGVKKKKTEVKDPNGGQPLQRQSLKPSAGEEMVLQIECTPVVAKS